MARAADTPGTRFERRRRRRLRVAAAAFTLSLMFLVLTVVGIFSTGAEAQAVRPPESAVTNGAPATADIPAGLPGNVQKQPSDADLWRYIGGDRGPAEEGMTARVSIPNTMAATLVQPFGQEWRLIRNGPWPFYGLYFLGAMLAILAVFYLVRGRIRIEAGPSIHTIPRFSAIERFAHWTLAVSFCLLGITGLVMLYGRPLLIPVIGHDAYGAIAWGGKWIHNNISWAFMLGIIMIFVMWVRRNIPNKDDLIWVTKAGGLFSKHSHPDAGKFNAGQKLIFWSVILLGVSLSLSGIALLFPFQTHLMGKTFALFNDMGLSLSFIGIDVSQPVTSMKEMQYQTIWHAAVAIVMIAVIIAHIYIGTLGMEGAFDAMGSGRVDLNWAKEHHNLWVEEVTGQPVRHHPPAE